MRHLVVRLAAALAFAGAAAAAWAQPADGTIRLALQEGGTAAWEAAAMHELGLDVAHGIALDIRPVADSKAGQVALQAGEVDAILSDFVWVSIQRHQGADFTFVPHSLAVGGLMAMPGSPVASVADLDGTVLAVAGGPVDKSYLVLQAYYKARTGKVLPDAIEAKFGAPPLVNELLQKGEAQAALNFWHFNARARVAGAAELISVKDMLADLGLSRQPPLLGWTFSEANAKARPEEFRRYLDASFDTKQHLLTDDAVWDKIRPVMKVGDDDALFLALRDAYRAGIVTGYGAADIDAAAESYAIMAEFGGKELIGDNPDIAAGTFWDGYRK
jgi:NitT/TauT family transport system substrate-binding protein